MFTRYLKLITVYVCAVLGTTASEINITPCHADDSKCAKSSALAIAPIFIAGIPELGIDKSDPIFIKKIDLSTGNIKLILRDLTITGIKDCRVKKVERDVAASKILFKAQCNVNLDGDYFMNGQILILPVQGEGKTHIVLRKIQLNVNSDMEEIYINGIKHWNVKNWNHTFEVKEKSDLIFENMFNGNEILGQAAAEVFSSGWKEIINELGPPLVKFVVDKIVKNVISLFHAIPLDKLILS